MEWNRRWQAFRYHVFVGVTLIGCVIPWVTPRLFPPHVVEMQTHYELNDSMDFEKPTQGDEIWTGQMEVLQNAC